jgi:hypothetical protein
VVPLAEEQCDLLAMYKRESLKLVKRLRLVVMLRLLLRSMEPTKEVDYRKDLDQQAVKLIFAEKEQAVLINSHSAQTCISSFFHLKKTTD